MLWYIGVCSMIGGISVSVTTGLGAAIVTTAMGDNQVRVIQYVKLLFPVLIMHAQFKHWFIYFLLVFVVTTLSRSKVYCAQIHVTHEKRSNRSVLFEYGAGAV